MKTLSVSKLTLALALGIALLAGISCAQKFDYSINDPKLAYEKAQNTTETLQEYDLVWKCIGRTSEGSNEFLVATLQHHPTQINTVLTVDRVVIPQNSANYTRYGIFMGEVSATITDADLELTTYTPKAQDSLPIGQRRSLARMAAKSQLLVLDLIKYADHSISIKCDTGDVFY